ncbi:MAG: RNA-guided pseudouridylation complex pseudouridine synthase subunit Cbf5 [Candidatus Kariarchaeaceae archaeon]|jgi:H/ACA ribonucleoprotein complex subunit 4
MNQFENLTILDNESLQTGQNIDVGNYPNERKLDDFIQYGIIILDKHSGPTSHEIVSIVKKILEIPKAGHSGTLDPNVTGVLPIALSRATKVLPILLNSSKIYVCNMQTSIALPIGFWDDILHQYESEIYQIPPLKSNVVKKLRKRRIYNLDLLEIKDKQVLFKAKCQSGTYIRTLCKDLGRSSGHSSYMKELRRIQTGPFSEQDTVSLHQIFDAYETFKETGDENEIRNLILPMEKAVVDLPKVVLRINAIDPIAHGSDLFAPGVIAYSEFNSGETIALFSPKQELVALGSSYQSSKYLEGENQGKLIHPNKILIQRGIYPKYLK